MKQDFLSKRLAIVILLLIFTLAPLGEALAGFLPGDNFFANGWYYTLARDLAPNWEARNIRYDAFGRVDSYDVYFNNGAQWVYWSQDDVTYGQDGKVYIGDTLVAYIHQDTGPQWLTPFSNNESKRAAAIEGMNRQKMRYGSRGVSSLLGNRVKTLFGGGTQVAEAPVDKLANPPELSYGIDQPQSGLAAGDGPSRWGIWLNGAVTFMGNSKSSERFDGQSYLIMAGADYRITPNILAGIGLGYESTVLDNGFDSGSFKSDGFILAPYVGVYFLEYFTLDAMAAFTFLGDYQESVLRNGVSDADATAGYGAFRTMVGGDLNFTYPVGKWRLGALTGLHYTAEQVDSHTLTGAKNNLATNPLTGRFVLPSPLLSSQPNDWQSVRREYIHLGEWKIGGRVSYLFDWMEPYLSLSYIYDVWTSEDESDRDEIEGIIGFNIFPCDNFMFSLEAANSFDRQDVYATRLTANLRYEF